MTDAVVERVEAFRVRVPLPHALRVWGREISVREFVFVRAHAGGFVGTAFALSRGMPLDVVVERQVAQFAIGHPVHEIRAVWNAARAAARMTTESGIYMRALSLVDLALWDLHGRVIGQPLWQILGGARNSVACLAICGYYRPGADWRAASLRALEEEATRLLHTGYTRFKIPFGEDIELDVARIRALRATAGPQAMIGLDASGVFDSVKQAEQAWRRIESLGVDFLEDPFPADRPELAAELARRLPVAVAYGESITSPLEMQRLGENAALDVLRPDATVIGGVTGFVQAIAPALERRARIFPHYYPDAHASLAAAFDLEMIEESPPEAETVALNLLRTTQPNIRAGRWHMSDTPGFGIEWNERVESQSRE
ncbi:MAG: mandelate racemase/muconate lactonizing enzyme family protein [Chloroflexi bacterium]|nr:mandelate racemase/muconate lactonizing enzyme family protein [Chloroflexota bacterium]